MTWKCDKSGMPRAPLKKETRPGESAQPTAMLVTKPVIKMG